MWRGKNSSTSNFCGKCGAQLTNGPGAAVAASQRQGSAPRIRVAPEQPDASTTLDGERKTVTALFADIKGSTAGGDQAALPKSDEELNRKRSGPHGQA